MLVLGIESSCDETGMALYSAEKGLLAHELHSQVNLHQAYGGVVPEIASRDHLTQLVPLLQQILKKTQIKLQQIDAIAYTAGPGLIGALLTGAGFAKSLAYSLKKPALAIHHLEAHVLISKLGESHLTFPFLALLVSGGHTQLIKVEALGVYYLLGETLDDAVGEAFDKVAKMMGIPYPGGARLAQIADSYQGTNPYIFPRPMLDKPGLALSFSGLKTHALQVWANSKKQAIDIRLIANAFQTAVVDTLAEKVRRALATTGMSQLVVAGGVSANQALRKKLTQLMKEMKTDVLFPPLEFCTDNGAMIAYTGYLYLVQGQNPDHNHEILVKARWPLGAPPWSTQYARELSE